MDALHDDPELARARRGDQVAIAALFDRHWPTAWRVAMSVTGDEASADDVAQDAFVRAVRDLERFDGRRPFAVWLHRIVVNEAIDQRRRNARAARLRTRLAHEPPQTDAPTSSPELIDALMALPEGQREVVFLHYWVGHTVDAVAAALDVPPGTVRSRLARAMATLRHHPALQSLARSPQ